MHFAGNAKRSSSPQSDACAARGASDDIVQDFWADVVEDLPRYCLDPGDKTFESWVSSIASHVVWNYVRRPSRRREQPLSVDLATVLLDEELGPEAELELMQEHELFRSLVRQFAERLSQRNGSILTKRFIDQKTSAAIAREIGVNPGCVRDFLHRVIPRFRAFLLAAERGIV